MKISALNRLRKLEKQTHPTERHRSALVIYDPKISDTIKDVQFHADVIILLPDNRRRYFEKSIPKSSYIVYYPNSF